MAAGSIVVDFPSMGTAFCFSSLESLLRDSASGFLAAVSAAPAPGAADLTNFHRVFSRVLSAYQDPPLEAVLFFSALSFHDRPEDLRSLLQLLSAFSSSSPSAAKPLALLAPVVSELFHSTKPRREVEALVEGVLSYISISCSRPAVPTGCGVDAGRLLPAFGELVKVWSVRHSKDRCPFQVLFPLAGEEARRELMKEGCSIEYLAGVVLAEAFLLRLCLRVQGATGVPRAELQKELRIWAVSSIHVFQNLQFFGILLNMLLHAPLPIYSLLSADDEILVRDILYDALILVDYSFITNGVAVDQADGSFFATFVSRLLITYDAVNDARSKGDQGRAMSFINAFSASNIPCYLIKWATHQTGSAHLNKPVANTPQALLKWLVDLEDKGLKVFGDDSLIRGRLIYDQVKNGYENRMIHSDADLFFIDKQSGGEVMDTKGSDDEDAMVMGAADNAFMVAAQSMKLASNGIRKRKGCGNEDEAAVKFVKYKLEDSSVKDYFYMSGTNGMSSGSEVENPQSDDEMEETN